MMKGLALLCVLAGAAPVGAQPAPDPTPAPEPVPEPEPVPQPPPAEPVAQPKPPPPERQQAPEPYRTQPEPPAKLKAGFAGVFHPGILIQGWFATDIADGKAQSSTFRARRAEIYAKGEILPKRVGYLIMFDVARVREFVDVTVTTPSGETVVVRQPIGPVGALQDVAITFLGAHADISIGQFKMPVSWEGFGPSAKLLFPERAPGSSLFGDRRDVGLKVQKAFPKWSYFAGVFNGLGSNQLDNNNQKDVTVRLEAFPVKGLTLAGVAYDSVGYRKRRGTKDRWEVDVRYETGPFLVQAEFIEARDVKADGADAVAARGMYGAFGYTVKTPALHGDLQPVVRVGYVDPDTEANLDPTMGPDDELVHIDVGLNYYLAGHEMKLQAGYQRQQFDDRLANNQLIAAAQVWY